MLIICITTIVKESPYSTQPPLSSTTPASQSNVEEHLEKRKEYGMELIVLCIIIGATVSIYLFHFPKKVTFHLDIFND